RKIYGINLYPGGSSQKPCPGAGPSTEQEDGDMTTCISSFRSNFQLMLKVSTANFDKPLNFAVFRSLQFASFKIPDAEIFMSRFLKDLETKVRHQNRIPSCCHRNGPRCAAH
ncbi:hypothetical protein VP01_6686g1, partial [Puccinia sorghi]